MSDTITPFGGGVQIPLESLAQTFVYVGNFLSTITIVYNNITYIQTFTNNGTNITAISQWVPQ